MPRTRNHLRREIEVMERDEFRNETQAPMPIAAAVAPAPPVRKIHFQDIEHAIIKFSGDD